MPFSVQEEKILDCQYGVHYYKKSCNDAKPARLRLQGTRKIGCLAKITTKKYAIYPEYKINEDIIGTSREVKQRKKETLEGLRTLLCSDTSTVKTLYKYFVSLPSESAHSHHPTGECAGFAQKLHTLIISKIADIVHSGITNITDIKRSLRWYVQNELAEKFGAPPKNTNRSLYPTDNDIRNHVYIAKKAMEFNKLDKENLKLKLQKWKEDIPTQSAFYRPYVKVENEEQSNPPFEDFDHKPPEEPKLGVFNGNNGGADQTAHPSFMESIVCSQKFLLVLQEEWQKKLLQRYGNTICLIDATYKTTQYELPLFFICVKTNVGYIIVAEFIVQSEESDNIREAIEILKSWNSNWCPTYFMCDYSEAELLAIEAAFENVIVYLCDFHREQAWERWVKSKQNTKDGLTKDEGDLLLSLLRSCATAQPCTDTPLPLDYYYQQAVLQLKQSPVWKNHTNVSFWLETYWLNIARVSIIILML